MGAAMTRGHGHGQGHGHGDGRTDWLLIGAGGHARAVVEAAVATIGDIAAYVDPRPAAWLAARHIADDTVDASVEMPVVMGMGGIDSETLERRLALLERYRGAGHRAPPVAHPAAHVSAGSHADAAAIILAGAVVQPGARLGVGAIVNTRAVVEHDSVIGDGAHIAPGAIVLGGCRVGRCALVGAGAVILPGTTVPDGALVKALSRYAGEATVESVL